MYLDLLNKDDEENAMEIEKETTELMLEMLKEIGENMTEINTLFQPITKYVISPQDDPEFAGIVAHLAKKLGWVEIILDPINHAPISSFDEGRVRIDVICSRIRHYVKFHHLNSRQRIQELSPNGAFDFEEL